MTLDPIATNPDHYSVIFVELKDSAASPPSAGALGPN